MKQAMHSFANRIAFPIVFIIIIIFSCYIPKIAANTAMIIFGFIFMFLLLLFVLFLIIKFKTFGYLEFTENSIIQSGFLCKRKEFSYRDYTATIGNYVSMLEKKEVFIFLKKGGPIINTVDTSKFGNVMQVNNHEILYCIYSSKLHKLLNDIYKVENSNEDVYSEAVERINKKLPKNSSPKYLLSELSLPERILYVLNEFDAELQNGGIEQYFINSSKFNAHLISGYLEVVNALDIKLLFDEFVYTSKIDFDNLDHNIELDEELCSQFDDNYFAVDSLEDLLIEFIKKYNL
ncbi:MAG: DUF4375 domain-containing protein [Bacilli bacterium]|nr:DUF4375 domain-containing protein [Bacilli bacterium]